MNDAPSSQTLPSEQVVMFGADSSLCGIVTRPIGEATGLPIIILNTGVIHRVGHHRMNVSIARRYAAQGHPAVRFDFGGIGDSYMQDDALAPLDTNLASIQDVSDWIETHLGQSKFILLGLCSGADQSIIQASRDPRIAGTVLIDPSIPRTFRFHVNDFLKSASRRVVWTNLATGRGKSWARLRRLLGKQGADGQAAQPDNEPFSRPDLENPEAIAFLEKTYQSAVDNGAKILAVFTGGHDFQHNYRTQLLDALPKVKFGKQLDLHYIADSDHTFTYERHRAQLFDLIDRWLETELAASSTKA